LNQRKADLLRQLSTISSATSKASKPKPIASKPNSRVLKQSNITAIRIEDEYKKIDPREHVLLRPDMYIGAVTKTKEFMWIYHPKKGP
jgi:hypothetical protein